MSGLFSTPPASPACDVGALSQLLDSGAPITVVDVREPAEYTEGHVPGARNIPLGSLEQRQGELDPRARLYLICQGGVRSARGQQTLLGLGFTDVTNVSGGTGAWIGAHLPVER